MRMLAFFTIVLFLFSLTGYYVYNRLTQAFPGTIIESWQVKFFYIFLLASFFVGKIVEANSIGFVSTTLIRIGSVAAGFFLYAIVFALFFDLIRFLNYIIPFYPDFVSENYLKTKFIIGASSFFAICLIYLFGYINARIPNVKELSIEIHKPSSPLKELNIVAFSDVHMGTWVNKKKMARLIKEVNKLNPDLVLIGGDIIDDNINVAKHHQLMEYFQEINSKYGVYSCMGNHDYISGGYADLGYYERNGIRILKDTAIRIDNSFYIVGRDDIQGRAQNGHPRKSIEELTSNVDFQYPVLLLDHQPYKLNDIAELPIDFQFSGHTHNGQMWPLNYITGLLFEEDWGYLKKKNTHFYISSGYGTAVVPIRVGNRSEIVHIKMTNK